jgi:hypothetical protein
MKPIRLAVLSALACMLLAACAQVLPLRSATYVLRPEQSVDLASGLTLTYDSFSDSRCPPNTECIWAGKLMFRFVLDGPNGARDEFMLAPDQPQARPALLNGGSIALDARAIPPARGGPNARPDDALSVMVKVSPQ